MTRPEPAAYVARRDAAQRLLDQGRLREAREAFDGALALAADLGDRELADRALCNRAAVAVALGDFSDVPRLREVLMAARSDESAFLAAYNVARAHELQKSYKKSLFYARLALERARSAARPAWEAGAGNQIGNCLLADSWFDEAAAEYERALATTAPDGGIQALTTRVNLGYCRLVTGRHREGFGLLFEVLRAARRLPAPRLEMIARLDLAYAFLEIGRAETAARHGHRGLALAEEIGEIEWIKNGLFLCGEIAVADGDRSGGADAFRELQERFYPGQPQIVQLLGAVDVRQLVNLRA